MELADFIKDALRTEAPVTSEVESRLRDCVGSLECLFEDVAAIGRRLDVFKKHIFYGRPLDAAGVASNAGSPPSSGIVMERLVAQARAVHAIIGKGSEIGELVEQYHNHIFEGAELDRVNVREEIGDGNWYDAILIDATQSDWSTILDMISQKLHTRFPQKFTEACANDRDLNAERAVLENGDSLAAKAGVPT